MSGLRGCVVRAQPPAGAQSSRRAVLRGAGAALLAFGVAGRVSARDYKEALAEKEARKNKLHAVAGEVKTSGRDQQVFKDSDYAVSEEARTPNIHSRQGEGAKSQINV